jgi:hypothetical protein
MTPRKLYAVLAGFAGRPMEFAVVPFVSSWPKADILIAPTNVRFRG